MTNFMNNVAHTDIDFPKVDLALAALTQIGRTYPRPATPPRI
jgi:hypothetical protein